MNSVYVLGALVCAVVGALPWLMAKRPAGAAVQAVISFFVLWAIFYFSIVSTVWPLFGVFGACVVVLWALAAWLSSAVDADSSRGEILHWPRHVPWVAGVLFYLGGACYGSEMVNTEAYRTMIGSMETREWTQDIQPKDPEHMRMVTRENALAMAISAIGQDGTIGSQLQIDGSELTLQKIGDELWYVAPLEFAGWGAWRNRRTSPGYVKVSAENPRLGPQLVNFPEGQEMQYAPSAFWSHQLERHMRNNGYLGKGLDDWTFEIDESGRAWWVITVFEPTIMWWAPKTTGVAVVDPATGETTFYSMGEIPDWVDRAVPDSYVSKYLSWWGDYVHGWGNSFWPWAAQKDIVRPGDVTLIYGQGGEPEWVTDITSSNAADNSIVGVVYTNSRTGKSVYYHVSGGATNEAVIEAVNHNQAIGFRKLHGADPQLYNVYGTMAVVVPLFNEANLFSGTAIVSINNRQSVAFGDDVYQAMRDYERVLSNHGERVALGGERALTDTAGIVDRINAEIQASGGALYYIHIRGIPHLFTGSSGDSPKLTVTRVGDRITITYYASDRDVVPLRSFDNLSLPLTESREQSTMRQRNESQRRGQEIREDSVSDEGRFKNLTPEQRRELLNRAPKPNP